MCSQILKLIKSVWSNEEWLQQWKESGIHVVIKYVIKVTKNHQGMSLLSTTYKMLRFQILFCVHLSRLISYIDKIIEDDHWSNRLKWEYSVVE
jgi:hypothetical protein